MARPWLVTLWTCVWSGVTLALLFVAIAYWTGLYEMEFRQNALDSAAGAFAASLITAAIASAGVLTRRAARRAERMPHTLAVRVPDKKRLPRAKSTARQPMVDLADAELGLVDLLWQLSDLPVVPYHVIEQAWYTATDSADRLRAVAVRLEAVEIAMQHAPPREWAALEDGAGDLRLQLDQGLDAYREVIAAAGRAALAPSSIVATTELVVAVEQLTALSPPE